MTPTLEQCRRLIDEWTAEFKRRCEAGEYDALLRKWTRWAADRNVRTYGTADALDRADMRRSLADCVHRNEFSYEDDTWDPLPRIFRYLVVNFSFRQSDDWDMARDAADPGAPPKTIGGRAADLFDVNLDYWCDEYGVPADLRERLAAGAARPASG